MMIAISISTIAIVSFLPIKQKMLDSWVDVAYFTETSVNTNSDEFGKITTYTGKPTYLISCHRHTY